MNEESIDMQLSGLNITSENESFLDEVDGKLNLKKRGRPKLL